MLPLLLLLLLLQFTFAVSLFLSRRTKQSVCCKKKRCAHSFSMFIVVVVAVLVLLLLFFRAMHVEHIAQIIMFAVAIFFCRLILHTHTHECICTYIYRCGFFCRLFCCLRRFVSLKNTSSRCMCAHIQTYNKQTQSNTMKIFAPPLHFCMQQPTICLFGWTVSFVLG